MGIQKQTERKYKIMIENCGWPGPSSEYPAQTHNSPACGPPS